MGRKPKNKTEKRDHTEGPDPERVQKLMSDTGFSKHVIQSALRIGCTDAQIRALKDEASVMRLIETVDPKELPDMDYRKVQEVAKPKPAEPQVMVHKQTFLDIRISPQSALTWKRGDYEQSELDHFLNRAGIKNLVRVVITRSYVANASSKYETHFEIHYKEPK